MFWKFLGDFWKFFGKFWHFYEKCLYELSSSPCLGNKKVPLSVSKRQFGVLRGRGGGGHISFSPLSLWRPCLQFGGAEQQIPNRDCPSFGGGGGGAVLWM